MGSHFRRIFLVRFNTQIQDLSKLENGVQLCVWFTPFCYMLNPVMSLVKYEEIVFFKNQFKIFPSELEKLSGI